MKIQCDVCNKTEASVFCSADEAALCGGCDHRIHTANKLSSRHIRFSLHHPSSNESPSCDICQEKRAFLFCQEERAILCRDCDTDIHRANQHGHKHNRFLLSGVKISSSTSSITGSDLSSHDTTNKALHRQPPRRGDEYQYRTNKDMDSTISTSTSISDYLIETLPGWSVDEFLDPSTYSHSPYKIRDHDLDDVLFPPQSEDSAFWVPQANSSASYYSYSL